MSMSSSRKNSTYKLFRILFINFGLLLSLVVVARKVDIGERQGRIAA